jgi:mono/diheme cytochrome c family protein
MTRANVAAVCALVAAALATACTKSPEREQGDFERMRIQQRDEAYAPSERFAMNDKLRHPPAGTVSRESASDTGAIGSGMRAGQPVTIVPLEVTPELIALGRQRFAVFCAVCHGAGGFGGSIVAANMGQPRPPSLRSAIVRARAPGTIFYIATHGLGRMPAYAPQLTTRERWAVVAYLEQLQRSSQTSPDEREDSLRAIDIRNIDSLEAAERRQ